MKKCPFCAEDIQDDAVVCKHCRRDLKPNAASKKSSRLVLSAAIVAVPLGAAVLLMQSRANERRPALAQQAGTPRPAPVTTEIVNSNSVEIPAGTHKEFTFKLQRSDCRLTGRIEGVDGGRKELEVRVLSDDDYINWKNQPNNDAFGIFKSPRQTVTNLDVALPKAGAWSLVVSNHWASFVGKTAVVHASLICG